MKLLTCLDVGNGDMKVGSTSTSEIQVFASIVGQMGTYQNLDLGFGGSKLDNMSLRKDGKEFAIGNMALKNSTIRTHDTTDERYVSQDTLILSHAAFAMTSPSTLTTANVVVGLPVHKMHTAQQVIKTYQGNQFGGNIGYFGQYETVGKTVKVDKAVVVAQPHGTLFNLILSENGVLENKELAKSGVAIFDIGYKTNDGIVFRNLEPIGRLTINSKNGMHVAFDEIRQRINERLGVDLKPYEIPQVIKTGTIRGAEVNGIINDALFNLAGSIISEVKSKWDDAYEIDNTVFTGGGAELLRPYLIQAYDSPLFPANCQTSNAEGMLKYAVRLWGREQ